MIKLLVLILLYIILLLCKFYSSYIMFLTGGRQISTRAFIIMILVFAIILMIYFPD